LIIDFIEQAFHIRVCFLLLFKYVKEILVYLKTYWKVFCYCGVQSIKIHIFPCHVLFYVDKLVQVLSVILKVLIQTFIIFDFVVDEVENEGYAGLEIDGLISVDLFIDEHFSEDGIWDIE